MDAPVIIDINVPSRLATSPESFLNGVNNTVYGNKGFPFDDTDSENRDSGSFHSHLDDLARRHPELAQHLNFDDKFKEFPFRSNTWGHNRRGSAADKDSEPSAFRRSRFGTPVGSSFEKEFGFPFNRNFEEEPAAQFQKEEPTPPEKATEKPPQVPSTDRSRKQNPNVPLSNTVDLGQKQEPVKDTREQRSMSAPPENRAGQQRFVSSVNIPVQNEHDGGATQPQAQQFKQQQSTTERVIPIHVEGRDEPVMPKNANHTFTQPQPQPERAFNQRPGGFGTWNRGDGSYYSGDPQFHSGDQHNFYDSHRNDGFGNSGPFKQQKPHMNQQSHNQHQSQPQQHAQQPHQPQHAQQPHQPQHPQQPQQSQEPQQPQPQQPPPPPPTVKLGPIDQILRIQKDVLELMNQVEKFNGKPKDKDCVYLDEMLTRNLLKLDDVETEGKENIRNARKEAIKCIQKCISILEAKANANELLHNHLIDISQPPSSSLEVSGVSRSGTQASIQEDVPSIGEEESTRVELQQNEPKESTPMQTNESEKCVLPSSDSTVPEVLPPNPQIGTDVEMESDATQVTEGNVDQLMDVVEEPKEKKDKKKVKKKVDKSEKK